MQKPMKEISEPHCCQFIATFLKERGLAPEHDVSGAKVSDERRQFLEEGIIVHHPSTGLSFHVTEIVMRATTEIKFSKQDGTPLKTVKHSETNQQTNDKTFGALGCASCDPNRKCGCGCGETPCRYNRWADEKAKNVNIKAVVEDSELPVLGDDFHNACGEDGCSSDVCYCDHMRLRAEYEAEEHAAKLEKRAKDKREDSRKEMLSPSALRESDIFEQFEMFSGYKLSFSKDGWGMIVKNGTRQSRIVCFEGEPAPRNELYKKRYILIQVNKFPNFGKKGKYVHCMNAILEYSIAFREEEGKILLDCGPSQINSPEYELLNSSIECLKSVIEECDPTN